MMKKTDILNQLNDAILQPYVRAVCVKIIDYICSISNKNALKYISYNSLCKKTQFPPEDIFQAISAMLKNGLPVLDIKFEFIESEDSAPIEIPSEDIIEARITNIFIHPDKGEPVESFKNKIFMYFSLSDFGKEIVCD
jgi:hypothetical protein